MKTKNYILLGLATFLFLPSALVQAQTQDPSLQDKVQELQTIADNLIDGIQVDVQTKTIRFEDYKKVYSQYSNQAEIELEAYKKGLSVLESTAQSQLSEIESEYQAVKNDPSTTQTLMQLEEIRYQKNRSKLVADLNQQYQNILLKVITLDHRLVFPAVRRVNAMTIVGLTVGLLGAPGILLVSTGTELAGGITAVAVGAGIGLTLAEATTVNDGGSLTLAPRVRNNFDELISTAGGYHKMLKASAATIFKDCPTSACVIYIADDYAKWMKNTLTLNKDIDLGSGVILHRLKTVRETKVESSFYKIAKIAEHSKTEVAE